MSQNAVSKNTQKLKNVQAKFTHDKIEQVFLGVDTKFEIIEGVIAGF